MGLHWSSYTSTYTIAFLSTVEASRVQTDPYRHSLAPLVSGLFPISEDKPARAIYITAQCSRCRSSLVYSDGRAASGVSVTPFAPSNKGTRDKTAPCNRREPSNSIFPKAGDLCAPVRELLRLIFRPPWFFIFVRSGSGEGEQHG